MQSQNGVILKKLPYAEADEIITVLLKYDGIRRFFVAGSRKSRRRFQGLIDQFAILRFTYRQGSGHLWRLQDVAAGDVRLDQTWRSLENFAFASYLAELLCELTPEGVADGRLYNLWCEAASVLKPGGGSVALISYVYFLVKLFNLTGYAIDLNRCIHCDRTPLSRTVSFDPVRGGLACDDCCPLSGSQAGLDLEIVDVLREGEVTSRRTAPEPWRHFLRQLTKFSQNIMQKPSKAAGFLLSVMA